MKSPQGDEKIPMIPKKRANRGKDYIPGGYVPQNATPLYVCSLDCICLSSFCTTSIGIDSLGSISSVIVPVQYPL